MVVSSLILYVLIAIVLTVFGTFTVISFITDGETYCTVMQLITSVILILLNAFKIPIDVQTGVSCLFSVVPIIFGLITVVLCIRKLCLD